MRQKMARMGHFLFELLSHLYYITFYSLLVILSAQGNNFEIQELRALGGRLRSGVWARLGNQNEADDADAGDDVRQPGVGGVFVEAENEGRESQQSGGYEVENEMHGHRDQPQGRDTALVVGQQAVDDEADAKHHRHDDSRAADRIEVEDEGSRDQENAANIVENAVQPCWDKTNTVHKFCVLSFRLLCKSRRVCVTIGIEESRASGEGFPVFTVVCTG